MAGMPMTMEKRMTKKRAKAGNHGSKPESGKPTATRPPELTPLDYALRIMRDEAKPDALRASMAKAAMPYLHPRGAADGPSAAAEPQERSAKEPLSSFEWARRVGHILQSAHDELRKQELAAQGWDVNKRGLPMDDVNWARIMERLKTIRDACTTPNQNLDRP